VALVSHPLASRLTMGLPFRWELAAACVLVFAIGLVDDIRGLAPSRKLLGQVAAAALACAGGVRISQIHGSPLASWLSVVVTLVWLIGCTNAFNLIDGIDGLASGVGVIATVTIMLGALLSHNTAMIFATVPLIAALLGFLRYNFNPASIFLGDSGSMTVGFMLGCFGVVWCAESTTILGMMAPIIALALPLSDTALAIARRLLRGQPVFSADRGHIHHRLLDLGLTPRRVVFLLYGVCAVAAVLSLMQSAQASLAGPIVVLFCASIWFVVQRLGYTEFGVLASVLADATSLRSLHARIHVGEFREALTAAGGPEDCWQAVRRYYRRFGYSRVTLCVAGTIYTDSAARPSATGDWTVAIPLSDSDFARLYRDGADSHSLAATAFADALVEGFRKKNQRPPVQPLTPRELVTERAL
jgi:UDP-GlcNAc:undecaprenyl-phosphate GlcNAc-1-phosphate transferase